jgi:hypothetical protein
MLSDRFSSVACLEPIRRMEIVELWNIEASSSRKGKKRKEETEEKEKKE